MPRLTVKIGGRKVGDGQPCYVVAELGQNHQGDVYHALRLIGAAHKAGADAVKLQKRHLASDMTTAMMDQGYSGPHSFGGTYGEHRKALELRPGDVQHLLKRNLALIIRNEIIKRNGSFKANKARSQVKQGAASTIREEIGFRQTLI